MDASPVSSVALRIWTSAAWPIDGTSVDARRATGVEPLLLPTTARTRHLMVPHRSIGFDLTTGTAVGTRLQIR